MSWEERAADIDYGDHESLRKLVADVIDAEGDLSTSLMHLFAIGVGGDDVVDVMIKTRRDWFKSRGRPVPRQPGPTGLE